MELVLFQNSDAAEIAAWPLTAEECAAWAGQRARFPLDPDQFRIWHADMQVHPFTGLEADQLVAYGELWVDVAEQEIELARILVKPDCRGKGLGQAFVTALIKVASTYGIDDLFLRVLPENLAAISCYEKCEFIRLDRATQNAFNQGQPTEYVWMKREPPDTIY